jgi:hypothetical protein
MDSERAASAPKVFVSYRREDTAGHAGRLFDAISARFGDDHVFMDVDLQPGVDFVSRIEETIGSSAVLLVIIGPRWTTVAREGGGEPRIREERDYVRLEVETALARPDVKVIPVLVGGAQMPPPEALPESLQPLRGRNALELSDARWRYDVGRLVNSLAEVLGEPQPLPTSGGTASHRRLLIGIGVGAVALVVVVLAVAGVFSGGGSGGGGGGTDTTAVSGGSLPASAKAEDLVKKYETLYEARDLNGLRKIMSPEIILKRGATFEQHGATDVIAEYRKELGQIKGQPNFDWQFGGGDRNEDIEEAHGPYTLGANGVQKTAGNFGLLAQIIGNQLYVKELCFDCPDLHHPGGFIDA